MCMSAVWTPLQTGEAWHSCNLSKSRWYFLWLRRRKQVPKAQNPEKIIIISRWLRDSEQRWRVINMPSAICIGNKNNVSQVNGQAILAILSIINIYFLWLRKIKQKHFFPFHSKSEQSNLHIWKSFLAKHTTGLKLHIIAVQNLFYTFRSDAQINQLHYIGDKVKELWGCPMGQRPKALAGIWKSNVFLWLT